MSREHDSDIRTWLDVVAHPVRLRMLRRLSDGRYASIRELTEIGHASKGTLRRHLDALAVLGIVREHRGESDGLTQGRPASCYSLVPEVRERVATLIEILAEPAGPPPSRTRRRQTRREKVRG